MTSGITFLVIFIGYLFDAIRNDDDDGSLNGLDVELLSGVRALSKRGSCFSLPIWGSKRGRRDALEGFVLALSDQQIVTGLSLCIIGFSRHCTMSTYHFFVIVALVWFSSSTHLSTFSLLLHYLRKHRRLRDARLIGMFALYVMLMVDMVVFYTRYIDPSDPKLDPLQLPVQCRFENLSLRGTNPVNFAADITQLVWLTFAYLSKLVKLSVPNTRSKMRTSRARRQHYQERIRATRNGMFATLLNKLHHGFAVFSFAYLELLDSFLWQLIWMLFGNVFGIRQLTWVLMRARKHVRLEGSEREFGFGQLLSLALLALPCLAAVEAFSGKSRGRHSLSVTTSMLKS